MELSYKRNAVSIHESIFERTKKISTLENLKKNLQKKILQDVALEPPKQSIIME